MIRSPFRRYSGASALLTSAALVLAGPLLALELPSTAEQTAARSTPGVQVTFPSGPYDGAASKVLTVDGDLTQMGYRVTGSSRTPYQLLAPLRDQLEDAGARVRFVCADTVCGGYDFRYELSLLADPAMHIDLGNFQYLLADYPDGTVQMIVTSRAPGMGYVEIATLTPSAPRPQDADATPVPVTVPVTPVADTPRGPVPNRIAALESQGHIVLDDLQFQTGSSQLGDGPFPSLAELADYLTARPEAQIALVGHTDAVGSLAANQALSEQRAEAVRRHLISVYGVNEAQVSARGIGFLAPLTTNATPEGREKNRRVEAVLASTQ